MAIPDMFYLGAAGLRVPDYPAILQYLQNEYRAIYGADTYLDADSQDGQWVAILALAMFDTMQIAQAVYSSFSPATAQGDALSRNVALNGIARLSPSHSTVDLRIVGQAGSVISNGQAEGEDGERWKLPAEVIIPSAGEITVTATAASIGAIRARPNSITKIATPTLGWQTVTNPTDAAVGRAVETDAELRIRQRASTMLPSRCAMDGIVGGVLALDGVQKVRGYENDTSFPDANNIPPYNICIVVLGGDSQAIADTIANKKTMGCGTHGSIAMTTVDRQGVSRTTRFSRPRIAPVMVEVELRVLRGYTSLTAENIKTAITEYINQLGIGDSVLLTKLFTPANIAGGDAVDITSIRLAREGGVFIEASALMAYDELPVAGGVVINAS